MTRYSIIPARAIEDPRLSPMDFKVLAALGTYTDKNGWCYPSVNTLADKIHVSRSTINRSLKDLQTYGYIDTSFIFREDGSQAANKYKILVDIEEDIVGVAPVTPPRSTRDTPPCHTGHPPMSSVTPPHVILHDTPPMSPVTPHELPPSNDGSSSPPIVPPSFQSVVPTPPQQKNGKVSRLLFDELPKEWGEWAKSEFGWSDAIIADVWANFADHWRGKAGNTSRKSDWPATWRNWCRKERIPIKPGNSVVTPGSVGPPPKIDNQTLYKNIKWKEKSKMFLTLEEIDFVKKFEEKNPDLL